MNEDESVVSSIIIMLLSSIVAGAAWKCQHDVSADLIERCRSIEGYTVAMRELYNGGWFNESRRSKNRR